MLVLYKIHSAIKTHSAHCVALQLTPLPCDFSSFSYNTYFKGGTGEVVMAHASNFSS